MLMLNILLIRCKWPPAIHPTIADSIEKPQTNAVGLVKYCYYNSMCNVMLIINFYVVVFFSSLSPLVVCENYICDDDHHTPRLDGTYMRWGGVRDAGPSDALPGATPT